MGEPTIPEVVTAEAVEALRQRYAELLRGVAAESAQLDAIRLERRRIEPEVGDFQHFLAQKQATQAEYLAGTEQQLAECQAQANAARIEHERLAGEIAELEGRRRHLVEEIEAAERREQQLRAALEEEPALIARVEARRERDAALAAEIEHAEKTLAEFRRLVDAARTEHERVTTQYTEAGQRIAEGEAALSANLAALEESRRANRAVAASLSERREQIDEDARDLDARRRDLEAREAVIESGERELRETAATAERVVEELDHRSGEIAEKEHRAAAAIEHATEERRLAIEDRNKIEAEAQLVIDRRSALEGAERDLAARRTRLEAKEQQVLAAETNLRRVMRERAISAAEIGLQVPETPPVPVPSELPPAATPAGGDPTPQPPPATS